MLKQSFWAILAAASFSCMAAMVKLCNGIFGPLELVFYRSLITTFVILCVVLTNGYSLKTTKIRGHLIRDGLGFVSVSIWFFTLGQLPLGTNITLTYTTSLFLAANFIILSLMRHFPIPWGALFAILLGFSGILIIMQPSFESGHLIPALLCLTVAFIDLMVYWQVRRLGKSGEPSWRIVFYFSLFCVIGTFFGVNVFEGGFTTPTPYAAFCVFVMGLFATIGMLSSTRAWVGGNMLLVSCLGFSAIPFSEIISILFFKHEPVLEVLIGMGLIILAGILSTLYTKKEEANLRRIETGEKITPAPATEKNAK